MIISSSNTKFSKLTWQELTVTRITNEILGVKGLKCYTTVKVLYQSDRSKLIDKESKPAAYLISYILLQTGNRVSVYEVLEGKDMKESSEIVRF